MYTGLQVAQYCVHYCNDMDKVISNLPLQKMLFYIQLDSLVSTGKRTFIDDILAWMHGPVVLSVYNYYSVFGASPLMQKEAVPIDEENQKKYNKIIDKYIDMDVWELVEKTHIPGGAWDRTYRNGRGAYEIITDQLMIECKC